jgi:tyrosyl-tRNA synthetase
LKNAETYKKQVSKVLDPKKTVIRFNSEWLNQLSGLDFIKLGSMMTVARMLERDDFQKRHQEHRPVGIHEFYYPLIQGYDSVALKTDVELGGTDQKFNLLVGRDLQRARSMEPQVVMTLPLLEGTDGVRKMSKSYDNYIALEDPPTEMFGKIMSISDALMFRYYELLTDHDLDAIRAMHPMEAKLKLAEDLVARYHSSDAASQARRDFELKFRKREFPKDAERWDVHCKGPSITVVELLTEAELVKSRSEARQLIRQGAVIKNNVPVTDVGETVPTGTAYDFQVGKKRFAIINTPVD